MAVSHVFSNPIADATGTLTVWNGGTTSTVAASQVVRPSDWNSVHNQFLTLGGNTAGASTVSGTNIVWAGGNNVTLSANGSTVSMVGPTAAGTGTTFAGANVSGSMTVNTAGVNLSLSAAAAGGGNTFSGYWQPIMERELIGGQIGQSSIMFNPMQLDNAIAFNSIVFPVNYSNATNSSNSVTLSMEVGIYTRTGNSLSQLSSTSSSWAATNSGTAGSYSIYGGPRNMPIAWAGTLTAGNYWIALLSKTTTGGGAGMTFSNYVGTNINSALSGFWSSANTASAQMVLGMGSFSAQTANLRASVAFTELRGSAAVAFRPLVYQLAYSTTA